MDMEDTWPSSSSPSPSPPSSPSGGVQQLPAKRKAGRKKFRETRHPVYRGVRARAGGNRWVCEVREPGKPTRIWLGTYPTPEMAARAHDVAAIALRGERAAALNFADSPAALPRAPTSSPGDIRRAAARAAELYGPSASLSIHAPSFTPSPSPPVTHETAAYVDEDAIFDLPALMEDMASGMLLTPPAMRRGVDWDDEGGNERGHMDCTLWMD